jgi:hypothetical protein
VTLAPRVRKFALTVHVTCSVGWLGSVVAFLALSIAGIASGDAQLVRGVYPVMELTAWFVIVPLSVASLLTGLVQALGTSWGLFRHYWVLAKLALNLVSTGVLLLYMENVTHLADVAGEGTLASGDLHGLRVQAVLHSAAALILLLAATTLSVYKPRGLTRYGWRKQQELRAASRT